MEVGRTSGIGHLCLCCAILALATRVLSGYCLWSAKPSVLHNTPGRGGGHTPNSPCLAANTVAPAIARPARGSDHGFAEVAGVDRQQISRGGRHECIDGEGGRTRNATVRPAKTVRIGVMGTR